MYLVTGGAGFIGSHIVERLVRQGKKVRIIDDLSSGLLANLKGFGHKVQFIKGDIRDARAVARAMRGVKYVIHEAALKSVPESILRPRQFHDVNVNGTFNLLLAAKDAGVRRFVFASSSSVYGDAASLPVRESFPVQPISPYGATKVMGEIYCRNFHQVFGLPTAVVRYFNVFGPRQDPKSPYAGVIPKFIKALKNNQRPTIFGNGLQSRDFTYIDNVVDGTLKALTAPIPPSVPAINIANGNPYSVLAMAKLLNKIMGKDVKPLFKPPRKGDILHSYADITLARKYLKYKSTVSFAQGLGKTVSYFI
ncbi:MAG: SDR family oxidoreductase [Candidatus Brocadiia bacterium]